MSWSRLAQRPTSAMPARPGPPMTRLLHDENGLQRRSSFSVLFGGEIVGLTASEIADYLRRAFQPASQSQLEGDSFTSSI